MIDLSGGTGTNVITSNGGGVQLGALSDSATTSATTTVQIVADTDIDLASVSATI